MKRILFCLFVGFVVSFLGSAPVWAQATGQINGTAKDQSGAVLPGVDITATQTETGVARTTITNETGSYLLSNLPTGPYRLEAGLPGFRTYVQTGIVLQVNASPVINVVLEVGQVSEQVEVQANAALVETRSTAVGQVIENERILELPLNGRQVTDLVVLAGSAVQTGAASTVGGIPGGVNISVAGGLTFGNAFMLDGVTHNNPFEGTNLPYPFPDAMQEFKVETSTLTAQNGMHSGAAVNGITKSGTNEFHGDLFEFVRNGKFNARNFFALKRDSLKRNQFGGTIGGPIRKNKVFFFGGYQGTTTRTDPAESQAFVPTAAMLAGDFTAYTSPACNGGRQIVLRAPFVNNRVDPALLSRVALNLSGRLPKPIDQCGKVIFGQRQAPNEAQYVGRIDYQQSASHSFFGRYIATAYKRTPPLSYTDNALVSTGTGWDSLAQSMTLGHTWLIGPSMVNAFRFAGNRTAITRTNGEYFDGVDIGIKNFYNGFQPKRITMAVTGGFTLGGNTSTPTTYGTATFQANDDLSFTRGDHQFSFGGSVTKLHSKIGANVVGLGNFSINGQVTGSGLADLLTGKLTQLQQGASNTAYSRQWYFGFYGQDTWKATPRLTVNYGLRWEPFYPQQIINGRIYHIDYDAFMKGVHSAQPQYKNAPAGLFYPGDPGFQSLAGQPSQVGNLAPRVGFGWDVTGDGRTAIRAAYGRAFDFVPGNSIIIGMTLAPPWAGRVTINNPANGLDDPYASYPGGNPFPAGLNPSSGGLYVPYAFFGNLKYDAKATNVHQWNLSVERQIGSDWLLSAAYLGTHTLHMWVSKEDNPGIYFPGGPCTLSGVTYNPCTSATNLDQRRRLIVARPQDGLYFSSISATDDGGTGSYNALQLSMRRRVSRGMTVSGNYTWSHCIGDTPGGSVNPGTGFTDPDNRNADHGNCGADRRHILNVSAVTETPQFAQPALRAVASGWKVSGIFRKSTGSYLTITSGRDQAFTGINNQRPDQVLGNPYGDRSSLTNYLNAAAFAVPVAGKNGFIGRANIQGPGTFQFDTALSRTFQIREAQRVEVRAEAFNVTNSLRRDSPATNLIQSTFGQTTTAADPRILQFALKYVF